MSLQLAFVRQTRRRSSQKVTAWRRRVKQMSPHSCESLSINVEFCCEIDNSLRGHEPGSTEAERSTALGVLPGDNQWTQHTENISCVL
jgi:hypothetical protein